MLEWYKNGLEGRANPEAVIAFAESFLAAPPSERAEVVDLWNPELDWTLPNPWRLACLSETPGSPRQRILTDLLFQALKYSSVDSRESILGFAVVFNSCKLAGLDPVVIFQEVASAVSGSASEALLSFVQREPEDQAMEAFMLTAVKDSGGGYQIKANW